MSKTNTISNISYLVFVFVVLALFLLALPIGTQTNKVVKIPASPAVTPAPQLVSTSRPAPTETPYPKPDYTPTLRQYEINKNSEIWHAQDPSSYITPNNDWVKYYASQLYVDTDGRIKYKNEKIPLVVNSNGNIIAWTGKPFVNNYTFDIYKEFFGNYDINNIPWLMPDLYLANGQRGVCSAWGNTITSMMLSGEMSIKDSNGNFVKQVIPAKSVTGYDAGVRDLWVEYQAYGNTWVTGTSLINQESLTIFWLKSDTGNQLKPVFEFTDTYFKAVN